MNSSPVNNLTMKLPTISYHLKVTYIMIIRSVCNGRQATLATTRVSLIKKDITAVSYRMLSYVLLLVVLSGTFLWWALTPRIMRWTIVHRDSASQFVKDRNSSWRRLPNFTTRISKNPQNNPHKIFQNSFCQPLIEVGSRLSQLAQ